METYSPSYLAYCVNYLACKYAPGVGIVTTTDEEHVFLKLLILQYADYTVIFSEDKLQLQYALDIFGEYCKEWHLTFKNKNRNI